MDIAPTPDLDTGLVHLDQPSHRSPALYQLAVNELRDRQGVTYWLDARNTAVTPTLYDAAPTQRTLDGLRIARAFTAYQHHTLVRHATRWSSPRTAMVVAPMVADLYRDDDVPDYQTDRLLEATITILTQLAETLDIPVLVTTGPDDELSGRAVAAADQTIECEETPMGVAYETEDFKTRGYWAGGWWQTTIPYWVDLYGTVGEPAVAPMTQPAVALEG